MAYNAPLKDMRFVLQELVNIESVFALPGYEDCSTDLIDMLLEEGARFASQVLAPLNRPGDKGVRWDNGQVTTAPGFKAAWKSYADLGWIGLRAPREYGGQGMPAVVAAVVEEMWCAANLAFSLAPMLTLGAIETIYQHASDELKKRYLPALITGRWAGTMNLTESQAGSDLAQLSTRALPEPDGTFRIIGQKIFITWGEHDMTENIIHMVLARIEGAPPGVKGLSLFIVPKFIVNADGTLGERNELACVSIEHKLGIHGSPTAVMVFGGERGAVGYLVGEPNKGLSHMFTMMNFARLSVGIEGIAVSERAYQKARQYARERVQSRPLASAGQDAVAIVKHPDVRRMLLMMKSQIEAQRALSIFAAATLDQAAHALDPNARQKQQALVNFLVPIVKGWNTEQAIEITSLAIQIHGGMGYIEETGVAQYWRDARITSIYEGTTGIQALDLIGRKTALDNGATAYALISDIRATAEQLHVLGAEQLIKLARQLKQAADTAQQCIDYIVQYYHTSPEKPAAGSVPFLKLMGILLGGWFLARAALTAYPVRNPSVEHASFLEAKLNTARFFGDHLLVQVTSLAASFLHGAETVLQLDDEWL